MIKSATDSLSVQSASQSGYVQPGALASSAPELTVSQVLAYFEATLKKKNNYVRLVKKYMLFCLDKGYGFDQISYGLYTADQWPSQKTPIKKFIKFAAQHHITSALPDPDQPALPAAANELILGFLDDAKNLTQESKVTYLKSLNDFFYFLAAHGASHPGHGFSGKTVARYVAWLKKENKDRPACSAFTVALRLSAVKQLAAWVIASRSRLSIRLDAGRLDALRDVSQVKGPTLDPMFHKDGLSAAQRDELISVVDQAKWQAVIALLSYEGLRTVEVTRLQIKDVDFQQMKLWVLGKGKDMKVAIRLFAACASYLQAYLQSLPVDKRQPSQLLFAGLNTGQIRYHVGKYLRAAGLKTARVSAHSLRHTAGQVLIAKGIDPVYVQQHLRHQDFSTTQIYVAQQTQQEYFRHLPHDL